MQERNLMRWIHLFGSVAIGTFVYSPWRNEPMFVLSMQILAIPTLTLTGLWMWQGHRLKKTFKSSQSQTET
jgi:hypothetical protein